ncbi:MAG: TetR/AcrR family transcriptional regulator [Bacillota bacterium]
MKSDKQKRIINAAIKEFTANGYEKASTNEIIKEARISKGSLFNYFNSKKELYLFLFEYIGKIIDKIYDEIDLNETDIFNRLRDVGMIKFKIMKKYPLAFDFLKTVSQEGADEVKLEINNIKNSTIENGLERIYENIDWTKFRDDMDLKKMINIINWTMLGFSEEQRDRLDSFEDINMDMLKEWDEYFRIMRLCFYKEGKK